MGKFPSCFINKDNARAIAKLQTGKSSIRKKYAAQLREMKKHGDTSDQISWFIKRIEDPEANIIHIQKLLDKFLDEVDEDSDKLKGYDTLIKLHKAHFGEKHKIQSVNINIDMTMSDDEIGELTEYFDEGKEN